MTKPNEKLTKMSSGASIGPVPEDRLDAVAERREAAKAKGAAANAQDNAQADAAKRMAAKASAKASPPVATKKAAPERIEQNGVKQPKAGTSGAKCWSIADKVRKANPKAEYKELRKLVIEAGVKQGEKKSQMSAETSSWAKFNGVRK